MVFRSRFLARPFCTLLAEQFHLAVVRGDSALAMELYNKLPFHQRADASVQSKILYLHLSSPYAEMKRMFDERVSTAKRMEELLSETSVSEKERSLLPSEYRVSTMDFNMLLTNALFKERSMDIAKQILNSPGFVHDDETKRVLLRGYATFGMADEMIALYEEIQREHQKKITRLERSQGAAKQHQLSASPPSLPSSGSSHLSHAARAASESPPEFDIETAVSRTDSSPDSALTANADGPPSLSSSAEEDLKLFPLSIDEGSILFSACLEARRFGSAAQVLQDGLFENYTRRRADAYAALMHCVARQSGVVPALEIFLSISAADVRTSAATLEALATIFCEHECYDLALLVVRDARLKFISQNSHQVRAATSLNAVRYMPFSTRFYDKLLRGVSARQAIGILEELHNAALRVPSSTYAMVLRHCFSERNYKGMRFIYSLLVSPTSAGDQKSGGSIFALLRSPFIPAEPEDVQSHLDLTAPRPFSTGSDGTSSAKYLSPEQKADLLAIPPELHVQFISFAYMLEQDIHAVAELLEYFVIEGIIPVTPDVLALECRVFASESATLPKAVKAFRVLAHLASLPVPPASSLTNAAAEVTDPGRSQVVEGEPVNSRGKAELADINTQDVSNVFDSGHMVMQPRSAQQYYYEDSDLRQRMFGSVLSWVTDSPEAQISGRLGLLKDFAMEHYVTPALRGLSSSFWTDKQERDWIRQCAKTHDPTFVVECLSVIRMKNADMAISTRIVAIDLLFAMGHADIGMLYAFEYFDPHVLPALRAVPETEMTSRKLRALERELWEAMPKDFTTKALEYSAYHVMRRAFKQYLLLHFEEKADEGEADDARLYDDLGWRISKPTPEGSESTPVS